MYWQHSNGDTRTFAIRCVFMEVLYLRVMILHQRCTPEPWSGAAGGRSNASAKSSSMHYPTWKRDEADQCQQ